MPQSLGSLTFGDTIMACFVGPPGSGKSIAELSWYKEGPLYVFDLDGRMRSAQKMYGWDEVAKKNILFDHYPSDSFVQLEKMVNSFENNMPYRTIVFSGLTMLAYNLIDYSLSLRKPGEDREGKGKKMGVIDLAGQEDFGVEARGLLNILTALKDMSMKGKCNVFLEAHLLQWSIGEGNKQQTMYQLMTAGKKIAAAIPGFFDEVYYFKLKTIDESIAPKYTCYTAGGEIFPGKSALHLPTVIDWTMTSRESLTFYDIIMGHIKASKERGF